MPINDSPAACNWVGVHRVFGANSVAQTGNAPKVGLAQDARQRPLVPDEHDDARLGRDELSHDGCHTLQVICLIRQGVVRDKIEGRVGNERDVSGRAAKRAHELLAHRLKEPGALSHQCNPLPSKAFSNADRGQRVLSKIRSEAGELGVCRRVRHLRPGAQLCHVDRAKIARDGRRGHAGARTSCTVHPKLSRQRIVSGEQDVGGCVMTA
eukprot:4354945-Prymnesium_polylepis.2